MASQVSMVICVAAAVSCAFEVRMTAEGKRKSIMLRNLSLKKYSHGRMNEQMNEWMKEGRKDVNHSAAALMISKRVNRRKIGKKKKGE